jgi:hypothetical protein
MPADAPSPAWTEEYAGGSAEAELAQEIMRVQLKRHCPDLAAVLPRDVSAFAPWRPVAARPVAGSRPSC